MKNIHIRNHLTGISMQQRYSIRKYHFAASGLARGQP